MLLATTWPPGQPLEPSAQRYLIVATPSRRHVTSRNCPVNHALWTLVPTNCPVKPTEPWRCDQMLLPDTGQRCGIYICTAVGFNDGIRLQRRHETDLQDGRTPGRSSGIECHCDFWKCQRNPSSLSNKKAWTVLFSDCVQNCPRFSKDISAF